MTETETTKTPADAPDGMDAECMARLRDQREELKHRVRGLRQRIKLAAREAAAGLAWGEQRLAKLNDELAKAEDQSSVLERAFEHYADLRRQDAERARLPHRAEVACQVAVIVARIQEVLNAAVEESAAAADHMREIMLLWKEANALRREVGERSAGMHVEFRDAFRKFVPATFNGVLERPAPLSAGDDAGEWLRKRLAPMIAAAPIEMEEHARRQN